MNSSALCNQCLSQVSSQFDLKTNRNKNKNKAEWYGRRKKIEQKILMEPSGCS